MDKYIEAIKLIVEEQEKIVGRAISDEIKKTVKEVHFEGETISIPGDPKEGLAILVDQYATLFGNASVEVSRKAIDKMGTSFSTSELPENLK